MELDVFFMPVGLQPVFRGVLLHKLLYSYPELGWLQQQQLDDEETHLGLVTFQATEGLEQNRAKMGTNRSKITANRSGSSRHGPH